MQILSYAPTQNGYRHTYDLKDLSLGSNIEGMLGMLMKLVQYLRAADLHILHS